MSYTEFVVKAKSLLETLRRHGGQTELNVGSLLHSSELSTINRKWGRQPIPESLVDFWTTASAELVCLYTWIPPTELISQMREIFPYDSYLYGGMKFKPAAEVFPGNSQIGDDNPEMKNAIGESAFNWWKTSAIFQVCESGNCLALNCDSSLDPPVVYLSQVDESSKQLASSFSSFLDTWSSLEFIGPELLLDPWIDPVSKVLDSKMYKTRELQRLFRFNGM